MMDRFRWGRNPIYGNNTVEAHFNQDDQAYENFLDIAREKLGYKIIVFQVVARSGLTVFVLDVKLDDLGEIIKGGGRIL